MLEGVAEGEHSSPLHSVFNLPRSEEGVWDRSLPRPVGETGRRSVGNGKERLRDYAGFPGGSPDVLNLSARRRIMDYLKFLSGITTVPGTSGHEAPVA